MKTSMTDEVSTDNETQTDREQQSLSIVMPAKNESAVIQTS